MTKEENNKLEKNDKKIKKVINVFIGVEEVELSEPIEDKHEAIDSFGRGNLEPANRKGDLLILVYEDESTEILGKENDLLNSVRGTLKSIKQ